MISNYNLFLEICVYSFEYCTLFYFYFVLIILNTIVMAIVMAVVVVVVVGKVIGAVVGAVVEGLVCSVVVGVVVGAVVGAVVGSVVVGTVVVGAVVVVVVVVGAVVTNLMSSSGSSLDESWSPFDESCFLLRESSPLTSEGSCIDIYIYYIIWGHLFDSHTNMAITGNTLLVLSFLTNKIKYQ